MNDIAIFLNNRVLDRQYTLVDCSVAFGDWCLTPVRYLFDGNKVTIQWGDALAIDHEPEFTRKTLGKTIAAIILLCPGVIIGTPFKLLGYLLWGVREEHRMIREHFTPIERIDIGFGSDDIHYLRNRLNDYKRRHSFNQPIKNLVIYTQEGVRINADPGFYGLRVEKIILVGARIIHDSCDTRRLDDYLALNGWESKHPRKGGIANTFVNQHRVASIDEAIESKGSAKRVFVVEQQRQ